MMMMMKERAQEGRKKLQTGFFWLYFFLSKVAQGSDMSPSLPPALMATDIRMIEAPLGLQWVLDICG